MFYQRLRDLREDKDLKQENIAEVIKISLRQYGLYERGKADIPLEKALILAEFYGVSLDYIAGRTNDKKGLTKNSIPEDEARILKKLQKLSDIDKGKIEGRIDLMIEQDEEEASIKGVI